MQRKTAQDNGGFTGRAHEIERRTETMDEQKPSIILLVFIISLAIPISFYVGPVRLSPYRLVLIIIFIPSLLSLINGKLGRVNATDVFMILFAAWGTLSLSINMPFENAIESSGIFVVESLGSYLCGRYFVSNKIQMLWLTRILFKLLLIFIPLAAYESITDRPILLDLLREIFHVTDKGRIDSRFGLHRSQVAFEHPILYGTFVSSLFGMSFYIIRGDIRRLGSRISPFLVCLASVFSVSSGAVATLAIQFILITWDKITKGFKRRWAILFTIVVLLYFLIDLISNRSPFHVFITYIAFSTGSAYNRILIWQYGSAEVWRHPLFGIGFSDWSRPSWMSASIDNFWLVISLRYGLPALTFLILGIVFMLKNIGRINFRSQSLKEYRAGMLVSIGGLLVAGATVDYWNAIFSWFFFLIGSAMWMLNPQPEVDERQVSKAQARPVRHATTKSISASRKRRSAI